MTEIQLPATEKDACGRDGCTTPFAKRVIAFYTLALSVAFLVASAAAYFYTAEGAFLENLIKIISSPSKLVTDYFALGGLSATFFNTAVCGLLTNVIIFLTLKNVTTSTLAAYMLVVAHGFYGLNFVNMWPPVLGVLLFCLVTKRSFGENAHIALFSTALGPFIGELLFRYALKDGGVGGHRVTVIGIVFALIFGLLSGFIVPALLPGTSKMHRGYNMYKAGLAIGILGIFVFNFMYTSFGKPAPETLIIDNPEYFALPYAYRLFMNSFFISIFVGTLIFGFLLNKKSFRGYAALWRSTGYGVDFLNKFGPGVAMINIGVLGLCIIAYLNTVFVLPEFFTALPSGVGFTGATVGVVFAALTFAADGQQPRTVFPIVLGYTLLFVMVAGSCYLAGASIPWTLSSQSYINGLAFSTGLCPFSGKYGRKIGVLAGFLSAVICTATAEMHGGLVLYNGGFTAGLTALVLLPILDFYKIRPKHEDD